MVLPWLAGDGAQFLWITHRAFADRLKRSDSRFRITDVLVKPAGSEVLPEGACEPKEVDLGIVGAGRNCAAKELTFMVMLR